MGLFNFFKKSGKKVETPKHVESVSEANPEAARMATIAQLEGMIRMMDLPVENLDVDLNDDQITVKGEATSQEVREKVVLALGNIEGIACVDDQLTVSDDKPEAKFYEVKSGDSLSKIAREFYGDAMKYPVIFEANKPMLEDPDKIYPGQMLRIPPLDN
jgi:nucleoid-associated protein YgaU